VTGWTFHDLRRTASTGMAALHVAQDVIDRVLNHAKGTLAGTYNRFDYSIGSARRWRFGPNASPLWSARRATLPMWSR
jgi:hypothetical protein